jgi:hypothetical protein
MKTTHLFRMTIILGVLLAGPIACGGREGDEAATQDALMIGPLGANGDSCTVRTGVPGTETDGECCSNSDPKDCSIILKPFPGSAVARW